MNPHTAELKLNGLSLHAALVMSNALPNERTAHRLSWWYLIMLSSTSTFRQIGLHLAPAQTRHQTGTRWLLWRVHCMAHRSFGTAPGPAGIIRTLCHPVA